MAYYAKAKVYSDGNHYIAIPNTTRPKKPKSAAQEPIVTVDENNQVVEEKEEISEIVLPSGRRLTEVEFIHGKPVPVKKKVKKGKQVSSKTF